jgi:hypothetical protein
MSATIEMNTQFDSTFSKGGFNAQMFVSDSLTRQLVNTTQELSRRCVMTLAEKYNFDAEEAIRMLGLDMIKVERKAPIKTKSQKVEKVKVPKTAFPLPWSGEFNDAYCYALRQNNGLYTQCTGVRKGENHYCKSCASQMQKTGAEMPEYGTIQQRMAVGIFEYVDPKGRKPVAYTKIMKKYKLSEEQVIEEGNKLNIKINPEHFVVIEEVKRGRPSKGEKVAKEKGVKGRPKKSKKVIQIEGDDEDLFATLVAEANAEEEIVIGKKGRNAVALVKSEDEKAAEKAEKEAKRLAEKAEKEAKLAAEKAEKEAKKEAERQAREAEKQAKKAAEEAEKQAKKEAAEKAKAEKEAKLAAEKAAKEAAKLNKGSKSPKQSKSEEPTEDDEPDVVKKIEFEGKKYLKSKKTGIVYDYEQYVKHGDQVIVGKWNDASNKLEFNDAEEEEEEYDM